MNRFRDRIPADWRLRLRALLTGPTATRQGGLFSFDLDSTLFDNRPRQARILREFGAERGIGALTHAAAEHWSSGWDMKVAMARCGVPDETIEAVFREARRFWGARFFTSEYCAEDVEVPGASQFLAGVRATTLTIAYVTGRPEGMREGTVLALRRCGFPLPDQRAVHLVMKPTSAEDDDGFKRRAHDLLVELGALVAAFDNEPTHANDYQARFPAATVVHLATDHSGRPVELHPDILSIPHFQLDPGS